MYSKEDSIQNDAPPWIDKTIVGTHFVVGSNFDHEGDRKTSYWIRADVKGDT